MAPLSSETLHATTIAINGRAVMLYGPSGSGKSDLGLRLIDRGASLVSDDYTILRREAGRLLATPPLQIAGRMEVRGVGLIDLPFQSDVEVSLLVELVDLVERLPETQSRVFAGVSVPVLRALAFEASAPIKIELMLRRILDGTNS